MRKLLFDKNLQLMLCVTLMVILSVSSISPALPKVMDELNVTATSIGLVITAFTLPGIFLAPIVGILADRLGRKKILVASLFTFGVFGTACGLTDSLGALLFFRFLQGVGVAPIGVLHATVIADLYEGSERLTAMGYSGTILSIGTATFPVIGGLLALPGWRYPFLLPVVAIPIGILVHLFLDNPEPTHKQALKEYVSNTLDVMLTRKAGGLFLITLITHIILYGCFVTYLPVLLEERFKVSPVTIGLILSFASIFTALCSFQMGFLARRFREMQILQASFFLFLFSTGMIPLLSSLFIFAVPVALLGAAMGLNAPLRISILTGLAPIENRASIMAVNSMLLRLGQTIAPVLMGLVLATFTIDAVYWAGAALALMMVVLARLVIR